MIYPAHFCYSESLINFPKRNSSGLHPQQPLPQGAQQNVLQSSSQNDQNSLNSHGTGIISSNNGVAIVNNSLNAPSLTSTSGTSIASLIHQNSMNSRQETLMNSSNNIYGGGNPVQIPSASSSNSIPSSQLNPSSPFPPTPTSNDTMIPTAHNSRMNPLALKPNMSSIQQQMIQPREPPDLTDSQSSVHQILHEMMMTSQLNGVSAMGNDMKRINPIAAGLNGGNGLIGNSITNSLPGNSGVGFGVMGGIGSSVTPSGLKATMASNVLTANNRVGMNHMSQDSSAMIHHQQQQHDMENRLLGPVNSFSNMQFDWKPSS